MAWFSRSSRLLRSALGLSEPGAKRRPFRKTTEGHRKPSVELLEDRVVPATVSWNSPNGGDWNNPNNWVGGKLPVAGDTAVIADLNQGAIVHYSAQVTPVALASVSIQSAGVLELDASTLNTASLTVAIGTKFLLDGGTLANADVQSNSVVTLTTGGGTLAGIILEAFATIDGTQPTGPGQTNTAIVTGGLTLNAPGTNSASVNLGGLNSSAQLFFRGTQILGGTGGTVNVGGAANNELLAEPDPAAGNVPATLTVGTNVNINAGGGVIGGLNPATDSLVIDSSLGVSNGTVHLQGRITNSGVFSATTAAATLEVDPGSTLTNFDPNTSTLGGVPAPGVSSVRFNVGGRFAFPGANIATDMVIIDLTGSGRITDSNGNNGLSNLSAIGAGADLLLGQGASLTLGGDLANMGNVALGDGAGPGSLTVNGSLTESGVGSNLLLDNSTLTVGSSVNLEGGSLFGGAGTVNGNVNNNGVFSLGVGNNSGKIQINGNYTQSSGGNFNENIRGSGAAGTGFDQLVVSGTASLAGKIFLNVLNNFVPTSSELFPFLLFSSSTGDFGVKNGFAVNGVGVFGETFTPTSLSLSLAPPGSTVLSVSAPSVVFNTATQNVTLSASVIGSSGPVSGGTVTFTVLDPKGVQVGLPVVSGTVAGGSASASFTLPANAPVGTYTVNGSYSGTGTASPNTASASFQVSPAATTASVTANGTVPFNNGTTPSPIPFTATVTSPGGTVSEGVVTFTVSNSSAKTIITEQANVTGGNTTAFTPVIPAGTPPGTYTVHVSYADSTPGDFQGSADTTDGTLVISPAGTTITSLAAPSVGLSASPQTVTLSATVASTVVGDTVNEGSVTFTVTDSNKVVIGTSVFANVNGNGDASVPFTVPANTALGTYTITAQYSDSNGRFVSSNGTSQLTVASIVTFTNTAGGDWDVPGNWSTGHVPDATNVVVIPNSIKGPVTHSQAINDAAASVTSGANVVLSGGSLTIGGGGGLNPAGQFTVDNGAVITLQGGALANAELTAGTTLRLTSAGGTLTHVIVDATAFIDGTQPTSSGVNFVDVDGGLGLQGGALNLGSASGATAGQLYFDQTGGFFGNGTVNLGGSAQNGVFAGAKNQPPDAGPVIVQDTGAIVYNVDRGTIGGLDFSKDSYELSGVLNVQAGGDVQLQGEIFQIGTLNVAAGATAAVVPGTILDSFVAPTSTLDGGVYNIAGTFEFPGAAIVTNDATIALTGPASAIRDSNTGIDALTHLALNDSVGSLTLADRQLTVANAFVNKGQLTIDATSGPAGLVVGGTFTQQSITGTGVPVQATTTLVSGGANQAALQATGGLSFLSGVLEGSGTITGNVTNAGLLKPGTATSPGLLTINGTYTQTSTGQFLVKLAGTGLPGVNFDRLSVASMATLAGTIQVSFLNNFTPPQSSSFPVIGFASSDGDFATKSGFAIGSVANGNAAALVESFGPSSLNLVTGQSNGTSLGLTAPRVPFQTGSQAVTVTATLFNPFGTVNKGRVDFFVTDQLGNVIAPDISSSNIVNGTVSVTLTLPPGTVIGTYVLHGTYIDTSGQFQPNSAVAALVVSAASSTVTVSSTALKLTFNSQDQTVGLGATVTSPSAVVNEGIVTFTLMNANGGTVGTPLTVPVASGAANTLAFVVPGGTLPGIYNVLASYSDSVSGGFQPSSSTALGAVTIGQALTVTSAPLVIAPFSLTSQDVPLSAVVTSPAGTVGEGSVMFVILDAMSKPIGLPVTAAVGPNGTTAPVSYTLPGGLAIGAYKLEAFYTDFTGGPFQSSSEMTSILSIRTPTKATVVSGTITTTFSENAQSILLTADLTNPTPLIVNEGIVSFLVFDGAGNVIGSQLGGGAVSFGVATAKYVLPGGTAHGTYTVVASYSDATGANFANDVSTGADNGSVVIQQEQVNPLAPSLNNPAFSQSAQTIQINLNVNGSTGDRVNAEGSLTFTIEDASNKVIGTPVSGISIGNGMASAMYTLPAGTPVGNYTVFVTYSDPFPGNFLGSSGSTLFSVTRADTAVAISPASVPFANADQTAPLSFSVTSAAGPVNEGTVTYSLFNSSGVMIAGPFTTGAVVAGKVSDIIHVPAGTPVGTYSVQAQYNDPTGPDYNSSPVASQTLSVTPSATNTATAPAFAPSESMPVAVTLNATVTSAIGTVTEGMVTFVVVDSSQKVVGSQTGGGTVVNGMASATYVLPANVPLGSYTIQAQYSDGPAGMFQGSVAPAQTLIVEGATRMTAGAAGDVPFREAGQSVQLSATVMSTGGTVNEGNVVFTLLDKNGTTIGSAIKSGTVSGGSTSVSYALPAATPAGTYTIMAVFTDTGTNFFTTTDASHTLTVDQVSTMTVALSSGTSFSLGNPSVTLNATVTGTAGPVDEGTVTFMVFKGSTEIGVPVTSGPVSNGQASAPFMLPSGTPAGTYTIQAQYSDSAGNFGPSASAGGLTATLNVSPATTTTSLTPPTVEVSDNGEPIIFVATVSSPAGLVNEGTVTVTVFQGSTPVGSPVTSSTLVAGSVKVTYPIPSGTAAGFYTVKATYSGGPDFVGGDSMPGTLTLDLPPVLPVIGTTDSVTLTHNQFPFMATLGATSLLNLPLTYSATVLGDNPLFDLQQKFQFQPVGLITSDGTAFVFRSATANNFKNNFYLLRSDGAMFAYDNSGSYNSSFGAAAPIAMIDPKAYVDPALLTNAQPAVDYTSLFALQQQFHFQVLGYFTTGSGATSATALVLQTSQPSPGFQGLFLVRSDGTLFAYDGKANFANIFANATATAKLDPTVFTHPNQLLNTKASPALYSQLSALYQQFDLQELNGSFMVNLFGHQAKWLFSPVVNQFGQHWYTLTLSTDGTQAILRAWEGYPDSEVGAQVATLDPSVYADPTLLTLATSVPAPAVNASVDTTGHLTVAPGNSFVGTFKILVTASDGFLSSSQTLIVNSTDAAPVITVSNNSTPIPQLGVQTVPHLGFPVTDSLGLTDAEGDSINANASVSSFSLPFSLQQFYQFKLVGEMTVGATAFVLQAANNNAFNNAFYLLTPDGTLFAYDNSGSFDHTIKNVTPIATLGSEFFNDPNLLINAAAPVNYTQLFNLQQQFQFTPVGYMLKGVPAFVLHSSQPGPGFNGQYLLTPDGNLYAYDGGSDFSTSIANKADFIATLDPSLYAHPSVLLNAVAPPDMYAQLQQTELKFDLQELPDGFHTGLMGNAAKWLFSPIFNTTGTISTHFYTLVLSANGSQALLYAWDGGTSSIPMGAQPVAVLDASVYFDPTLLLNAKAPVTETGASASVSGSNLNINAPASFVGSFLVTVSANDGALTSTRSFVVTSTDTAPVPAAITDRTVVQNGSFQVSLASADAENDPVTFKASVAGFSAEFALQQQYHFTGVGKFTTTNALGVMTTAQVVQSAVLGGAQGFYLVDSNGNVFAYDGSGDFSTTFANSANRIGKVSASVFNTPTLLTAATAPAMPAAKVTVLGNMLTVDVTGLPVGTMFEVFVTGSDGAESNRTGFLVTVTA
jgi:hypothetical protein